MSVSLDTVIEESSAAIGCFRLLLASIWLFDDSHPRGRKWHLTVGFFFFFFSLTVVLICISLTTNDAEHSFLASLSRPGKMSIQAFCRVKNLPICFLIVELQEFLYKFWTSQVAQWVKNLPAIQRHRRCGRRRFDPWVGKIPWKRKWQPTPVFSPGASHGPRSLSGYSSWGCKESDVRND